MRPHVRSVRRRTDDQARMRWTPVALVAAAIWALAVVPGTSLPAPSGTDLIGHALEFAVLGALASRASNARSRALIALCIGLAVGIGTELSQLLAVARNADVADLTADLLGTLLGAGAWALTAGSTRAQARDGSFLA